MCTVAFIRQALILLEAESLSNVLDLELLLVLGAALALGALLALGAALALGALLDGLLVVAFKDNLITLSIALGVACRDVFFNAFLLDNLAEAVGGFSNLRRALAIA